MKKKRLGTIDNVRAILDQRGDVPFLKNAFDGDVHLLGGKRLLSRDHFQGTREGLIGVAHHRKDFQGPERTMPSIVEQLVQITVEFLRQIRQTLSEIIHLLRMSVGRLHLLVEGEGERGEAFSAQWNRLENEIRRKFNDGWIEIRRGQQSDVTENGVLPDHHGDPQRTVFDQRTFRGAALRMNETVDHAAESIRGRWLMMQGVTMGQSGQDARTKEK